MNWQEKVGERVKVTRNRFGYQVEGVQFQRVTTLLKGIPKPALIQWAANCVAEFAVENLDVVGKLNKTDATKLLKGAPWTKRDDAGDRGTAVHNAVESYLNGTAIPDGMTEDEYDCACSAEAFLKEHIEKVLAVELTVFNVTHEYAGTLDLWALGKNGKTGIWDWKTSGGVYPDYAAQQTAYYRAEYAVVDKVEIRGKGEAWEGTLIEWGPEQAQQLGIVHIRPDNYTLHPINYTKRLWQLFMAAAWMKKAQADYDDYRKSPKWKVYGEPIEGQQITTNAAA